MSTFSIRILLFCLVVSAVGFITAEVLANSGYPMKGANPQRNYQVNKKLLCPQVAPGRTQVWNIVWQFKKPIGYSSSSSAFTQDEEFIYLRGSVGGEGVIIKINATDGTYNPDLNYVSPYLIDSIPTHVQGNKMYFASEHRIVVVNTTSMQEIASQDPGVAALISGGSFAPYDNDLMVSTLPSNAQSSMLFYLNTTSLELETNLLGVNISAINPSDVIIYKSSDNVEIPIVVYGPYGVPVTVWSPNYQFTVDGSDNYRYSFVQNDQLVIVYGKMVGLYNANTGALLRSVSLVSWQGTTVISAINPVVIGNKSLVSFSGNFGNHKTLVVDFLNNKTLLTDVKAVYIPLYSIPDNSVFLTATDAYNNPTRLISLDWDTQTINAVASFPPDGQYDSFAVSSPLVGNDCSIYTYYSDTKLYLGVLFALKPLPISNVVPIVECINADGVGYFSYNNMEDKRIVIPYVSDRNNLSPLGAAPAMDFAANRRGKYFPLSSRFAVNSTTGPLTWQLEDYVVSFSNTAQLRCPQNVTVVLYFNTTNTVPSGFSEWTRQKFASLMQITDSRVTIAPTSKRNTMATFEVRLYIVIDNSNTELTPEQAAQQFNQKIVAFNKAITLDSTYSSAGVTLIDIDGVPLDTEISGTLPPKSPISSPAVPTSQPSQAVDDIKQLAQSKHFAECDQCLGGCLFRVCNCVCFFGVR